MPLRLVIVALALTLLVSLVIGALGGLRMRRLVESRSSRVRTRRGLDAEQAAHKLLRKHGYRVLGRQVRGGYDAAVSGDARAVQLTADYLVSRGGRELVVEVKTGDGARFAHADTRRQMLEYQLAFGVDAVILLDADHATLQEVTFPLRTSASAKASGSFWLPCLITASVCALLWWSVQY